MTDSDIIRLFYDRDERAIAETAEKYGRYCMTIARDILDSEQDAEECVSDVYLKAWNSIPADEPASLKAYVAVLTRRLILRMIPSPIPPRMGVFFLISKKTSKTSCKYTDSVL